MRRLMGATTADRSMVMTVGATTAKSVCSAAAEVMVTVLPVLYNVVKNWVV
jgi:hypothetical protein